MISKMVTRRQTNERDLHAATREYAAPIAEALRVRLAPALEAGRDFPDFEHLINLLGDTLAKRASALEFVAEDHKTRRQNKDLGRARRNAAASAVRRQLVSIRAAVVGVFGPEAMAPALGFEQTRRLDNQGLLSAARGVITRLAAGPLNLPQPRVAGAQVDTTGWLEELSRLGNELSQALEELSGSSRQTERQLIGKNSSLVEFDQLYGQTAGLVKALMVYAGFEEHAQRLRPASSRPAPQSSPEPVPPSQGLPPASP